METKQIKARDKINGKLRPVSSEIGQHAEYLGEEWALGREKIE